VIDFADVVFQQFAVDVFAVAVIEGRVQVVGDAGEGVRWRDNNFGWFFIDVRTLGIVWT
jgi:hypothetical protein